MHFYNTCIQGDSFRGSTVIPCMCSAFCLSIPNTIAAIACVLKLQKINTVQHLNKDHLLFSKYFLMIPKYIQVVLVDKLIKKPTQAGISTLTLRLVECSTFIVKVAV